MAEDGDGFIRRVSKEGFHFDALAFDWPANGKQELRKNLEGDYE